MPMARALIEANEVLCSPKDGDPAGDSADAAGLWGASRHVPTRRATVRYRTWVIEPRSAKAISRISRARLGSFPSTKAQAAVTPV